MNCWCQNRVNIERNTLRNATWNRKGSKRGFAAIYNENQGFFRFRVLDIDEKKAKTCRKIGDGN